MKYNGKLCISNSWFNYFQDVRIPTVTEFAQDLQDMGQG